MSTGDVLLKCGLGLALALVAAGLLASVSVYLGQDKMLFTGAYQDLPAQQVPATAVPILDSRGSPWAWVVNPEKAPKKTVIYLHGNGVRAEKRMVSLADTFTSRGYRVVFPEYPGFGVRKGVAPNKEVVLADLTRLIHKIRSDFPNEEEWLFGESLGAGLSALLASPKTEKVVLITPWHRMSDVAAEHFPLLPIKWLVRSEYDSCEALLDKTEKVHVVYAGKDELIPARHAESLTSCLSSQAENVLLLPYSTHNDWQHWMAAKDWDALLP